MLGHRARNRLALLRLRVSVTDAGRNPSGHRAGSRNPASIDRRRAIVGIGTAEREGNEPDGLDGAKPVAEGKESSL
jgi:phthiodiolone/phenolphthiodiolone dimycocerosates ketoreductase